jgi:hypothetical protein
VFLAMFVAGFFSQEGIWLFWLFEGAAGQKNSKFSFDMKSSTQPVPNLK